MKDFIKILIVCAVVFVGLIVVFQRFKNMKNDLNTAINNEKAALAEKDSLKNQSIAYKYTIEQLACSNDSIINKLNDVRKELKIKDKKIKELAYIASEASKKDTIIVRDRDTIFRDPEFKLDTIIGDKWYQCELGMEYPNKVTVSPTFKSEKSIIVSTKKETLYPEKKCWLLRIFQKKHTIVEVNVVEKSPYIETQDSKFIEVIK